MNELPQRFRAKVFLQSLAECLKVFIALVCIVGHQPDCVFL